MTNFPQIWEDVKTHMQTTVSPPAYWIFINPLRLISLKGNSAILLAGSIFNRDWVAKRYGRAINSAFSKALAQDTQVQIVTQDSVFEIFSTSPHPQGVAEPESLSNLAERSEATLKGSVLQAFGEAYNPGAGSLKKIVRVANSDPSEARSEETVREANSLTQPPPWSGIPIPGLCCCIHHADFLNEDQDLGLPRLDPGVLWDHSQGSRPVATVAVLKKVTSKKDYGSGFSEETIDLGSAAGPIGISNTRARWGLGWGGDGVEVPWGEGEVDSSGEVAENPASSEEKIQNSNGSNDSHVYKQLQSTDFLCFQGTIQGEQPYKGIISDMYRHPDFNRALKQWEYRQVALYTAVRDYGTRFVLSTIRHVTNMQDVGIHKSGYTESQCRGIKLRLVLQDRIKALKEKISA